MSYQVKELFYTLQGEGAQSGRAAVFCRFAGCNLWTGREVDRAEAACWFCDTDFVGVDGAGGGKFGDAAALADAILATWPNGSGARPLVVFTGGEPTLQLDEALVAACRDRGFESAIETNGTRLVESGVDWITVSPKPNSQLVQCCGNELKLVFPHEVSPEAVQRYQFDLFFLSPLQTDDAAKNRRHLDLAIAYCKRHPQWRLTGQYHKLWGIA